MKYLNSNLITLKCVLFLFFGGLGCLYPFLPLHMTAKNLTPEEAKIISIVSPCVAILGPLVAGPLADKLAGGSGGKPRSKTGQYLRVMIALCFILSAIFYWILVAVPTIAPCVKSTIDSSQCDNSRNNSTNRNLRVRNNNSTSVGLVCNKNGGHIYVEKCIPDKPCSRWDNDMIASFYVTNCTYTCENEDYNDITTNSPEFDYSTSFGDYDDENTESGDGSPIEAVLHRARPLPPPLKPIPHPHLCYTNTENQTYCHVYSLHSKPIQLQVPLKLLENEADDKVCTYPISGDFHCRISPHIEKSKIVDFTSMCNPIIKCPIHNPYNKSGSVFIEPTCTKNTASFWIYLIVRCISDIFPAAAVTLLNAAVIIATRETSTGRGDAGKQFAAGALGFAICAPIIGAVHVSYIVAVAVFSVFMVVAALVILIDSKMPLSPPEWWWHTRCGLLALPMSTVRNYGLETAAVASVLLLLGVFWNGIDPYLPWHIIDLNGNELTIGLTVTVGALPAVIFLVFIERIVDYCGHNNLLIASFTFYIIHYTALYCIRRPWLVLLCEALEIFTLHVTWTTAIIYLRHLIPRRFTVSGQIIPVVMHFCLGRLIGTLLGGLAYPKESKESTDYRTVYEGFAAAAAIIAIIYFLLYHFYLKPKCAAPVIEVERPPPALIQNANGNGGYTPLRVYHNSRAKKGQFKY